MVETRAQQCNCNMLPRLMPTVMEETCDHCVSAYSQRSMLLQCQIDTHEMHLLRPDTAYWAIQDIEIYMQCCLFGKVSVQSNTDQLGAVIEVDVRVQRLPELHGEEDVCCPGPLGRVMALPLLAIGGGDPLCQGGCCGWVLGGCHWGREGGCFLLQGLLILCLFQCISVCNASPVKQKLIPAGLLLYTSGMKACNVSGLNHNRHLDSPQSWLKSSQHSLRD